MLQTIVLILEKKRLTLLLILILSITFWTCKKKEEPNPIPQSDPVGYGLVSVPNSIYALIPNAPNPPAGSGNLPETFFLDIPSNAFSQGIQGSCSSCATAMAKSVVDHVQLGTAYPNNKIIYSPSYLYNQTKDNPVSCEFGSQIYRNLEVLKTKGVCKYDDMPYSEIECSILPSADLDLLAASHKIDNYYVVNPISVAGIKQNIKAGSPVIVAFRIDNTFRDQYKNGKNKDKVWSSFEKYTAIAHATILYGWDDSKNAFRMLNSWGKSWADNGSVWVDYNLIENGIAAPSNDRIFYEAYIIRNPAIVSNNNLEVTGTLDFGNTTINTTVTKDIQLKNTGTSAIKVSGVTIASPFTTNWLNGTIDAGQTKNVTIAFNPTATGNASKVLTINSDASNSPTTITATGNGVQQPSSTRIISLSGSLSFGNVTVGQSSTKTLTISNNGNSPLSVSSVVAPPGFLSNYTGTIQPGKSENVSISFSPLNVQSYDGNVTVNSDATSGPKTIAITGNGTSSVTPTRVISLSGNLNFGNVTVGEKSSKTLTISNQGNSALTINSVSTPTGFSGNFSGKIDPGSSKNVSITFSPTSAKTYNGDITVSGDETSGTTTINAKGTGVSGGSSTPSVTPAVGSYGDCWTGSFFCTGLEYGVSTINARVVSMNTSTHKIVIEIKKCNGTAFNAGGNLNVVSDLCSGVSYAFDSFTSGSKTVQITITDNNMTGVKSYYAFIAQGSNFNILYTAPPIIVNYN